MAHDERNNTQQTRGILGTVGSGENHQRETGASSAATVSTVPEDSHTGGDSPENSAAASNDNATASNAVPEGFTLSLALVDALPVIFFALMCIVLGQKLDSGLFVTGAIVAFLGGTGKVLWKLVIAMLRKNIPWLNRQMRFVMPLGFILMIAGAFVHGTNLMAVLEALVQVPSILFVCVWLLCMVAMGYFAGHRQQNDAHSNWVEQGVNTVGQAALLAAVLLA